MENQAIVTECKKRALSCIQPTGTPTLGNYIGAGVAIKKGAAVIKKMLMVVIVLLFFKVLSEFIM